MAVTVNGTDITLTGDIGDYWYEDCVTQSDVIGALAEVGRETDITVHLNSGGGVATEGAAIHASLSSHKGKVHVIVEGWAASAASLIAMAGDRVSMARGSVMMIHDPAAISWGPADQLRKDASALDALGDAYAGVYSDKCKKPAADVRKIMKEETWYRPEEAVAAGFADDVLPDSEDIEPTAFSGVKAYARAPERIVALAQSRGWNSRAQMAAQSAAQPRPKEESMTDKIKADEDKAAEEMKKKAEAEAAAKLNAAQPADPAAIAEACEKAGFATLTAGLLRQNNVTMETVNARIAEAKEISDAATAVGLPSMSADLIASGISVEMARKLIFSAKAAKETPNDTTNTEESAVPAAWSKVVDRINARR